MKNDPLKPMPAKSPASGSGVDLTELFRRAGLPHKVVASARFADCHGLTGAGYERHEHYALVWSVRCALTGCLPARRFRTNRGELLLIEYPCFPGGGGQDQTVWVAALLPAPGLVQLLLPEELEDLT
jgi:hypothetical protein